MNLALFFFILLLDQAAKAAAARFLGPSSSVPLLPLWGSWPRLTYHENTGAAFGLFGGGAGYLAAFSWVFIAGLATYLAASRKGPLPRAALVLVLAGAVGNAVDRIRLGRVIDFIDFGFWPIFNIADSAITLGALWLAASVLIKKKAVA